MRLFFRLLVPLVALGCSVSEPRQTLMLTGSSTVAPLAGEIARRFEARHPGVRVDVQTGGSSRGIVDARRGVADIGMASRDLADGERDLLSHAIARDGLCMIVHRDNPIAGLSDEQVRAIYQGRITRWSEVGGRDRPITVVHKAAGRATQEVFLAHFRLAPEAVRASVIIGDNQQGIKTVAGNPDAVGYVSLGTALYDAAHSVPLKLLAARGVAPSLKSLNDGSWPISRTLNLITRGEPQGLVEEFLELARSPAVDDLIAAHFLVPAGA